MLRVALVVGVVLVFLAPAPALAKGGNYNGQCRRITRQIDHYKDVVDMAEERGNDRWEQHTLAQIQRLSERRVRLCPEFTEPSFVQQVGATTKELGIIAGKAAISWFSFGAF